MARRMVVTDYDPDWERAFRAEAKAIRRILGKNCVAVYHIGSTAVKGMPAKPIIDIMPVVRDLAAADGCDAGFEALGYECCGEYGIAGRRFYRKGGDNRTHHVHIFESGNRQDIDRHLAVRDYLRSHPAEAEAYAALKRRLADQFPYDNNGYCDGKAAFVDALEQKAMQWRGEQNRQATAMSLGMCFGMAVGTAIGAALGQIALGMCMGLSIGMCIGVAVGAARK